MFKFLRLLSLLLMDGLLVNLAFLLALWLRFEGLVPRETLLSYGELAPLFTVICLGSFYAFGLYRRLWQYASLGELVSIVYAVTLAQLLNITLAYFWIQGEALPVPRSVFVLAEMAAILFVGGARLSWRLLRDRQHSGGHGRTGDAALIVGAGDAGAAVARELQGQQGGRSVPVGFIDDDAAKRGLEMFGLRVLGSREDIPRLVQRYAIREIIIAIPSAPGRAIREIVAICQQTEANLRILPGMYELINGQVTVSQIREVRVEDILGREPVQLDLEAVAGYLAGRTVLVTGAGGSIGSELCRQIALFAVQRLVLLGQGENSIYQIHQELSESYPELELVQIIADVKDEYALDQVFQRYRPGVVFHAAAHKHVPLMEGNPAAAVKNNVWGTYCAATAARKYGTHVFITVSTDKAVNPTSVMGATKRAAEMVVQQLSQSGGTKFAAVRFGNVLGSRGSVVPLFQKQIARGGPVTVTHPEMVRYFMTIPEAAQLVVQAGALAAGGEVFVLDMGEPVKIVDLAAGMIRLSGFRPGADLEIVFTGIRPGEKLYEELLTDTEGAGVTRHQRIYVAAVDRPDADKLNEFMAAIQKPDWLPDDREVMRMLQRLAPEYKPAAAVNCAPDLEAQRYDTMSPEPGTFSLADSSIR